MIKEFFFPNDGKTEHFAALDGLRGFAVLLVLISHANLIGVYVPNILNYPQMGTCGVQLFFVLSAYLLDRQIANALLNQKADKRYWLNYALRRFLRIYPMFFLSLLLYYFLTMHVKGNMVFGHDITIKDITKHLLLQKGEGFYWSIPVEFKYYFLSPFLMLACHYWLKWDFKKVVLFFGLITLGVLAIKFKFDWSKIATTNYLPIFFVGTIFSVTELLKQTTLDSFKKTYPIAIDIIGIIAFITIFVLLKTDNSSGIKNALLWGLVLFAAKYGRGMISYIFSFTFLRLWGIFSFSAYLLHRAILGYVYHLSPFPNKSKLIVFLILSLLVSLISYLVIEKPLSKIRLTRTKTSSS